MYAGRKRRKPVQKRVKPTPAEGAKSNPSKRHRDRLNSELDRLASLLPFPEDVVSSLDKLSILRLSVSYLRTKSFFSVTLKNQPSNGVTKSSDHHDDSKTSASAEGGVCEGELLLQALNGFVVVVTAEGIVFFCSHTIQDYLGFHQTDVMHQSVFDLIHTEDQQEFRRNLHWALNPPPRPRAPADPHTDGECVSTSSCLASYDPDLLPPENSSFLERSFVCRFRCLLDNSSGFLALNIQGRLKFLHGQSRQRCDSEGSSPPQLALFAIATPLQPPAILEIRTRNMIFRTKHKLDFTPMSCDAKGKIVLGYTEAELRVRGSGYQFIHAADMLYCAENHVRSKSQLFTVYEFTVHLIVSEARLEGYWCKSLEQLELKLIKTGESGLTVFRLLTKDNRWKWVQANARLVYKNGKPDYIIATQRPLVDEEGGEHLRKRSMHLPFTFATGEALLYQTGYPLHGFPDSFQGKTKGSKSKKGKLDKSSSDDLDPKSLLGALMSQDESVYVCQPDTEPKMSYHSEHQGESSGFGGLLSGDSWHILSNGETARCNSKTSSYDPLLATLDSLSLEGDETCSNSELFSALENLGLNAEDLELLLLDERMIQVELDNNHIPTLSDLLTNNEILSYIHDSLDGGTKAEEQGDTDGFGPFTHPDSNQSASQQSQASAARPRSRQPIVQLSQQMQQHMSAGELQKAPPSNGHWVVAHPNNHTHRHPQTVGEACQLNGELSLQWQLQTRQHSFQNQLGLTNEGLGHADHSNTNGVTVPDVCHYQQQQMLQVAPSCLPPSPTQSSALELEQFLALSQPQHSLPSLEAYSVFNTTTPDSAHSKLENSCLLSAASAAYIRTCLMPNRHEETGDVPVSCPDALPALQDPQKSGFFL
ncbi:hypothetical protein PAMA_014554 [Pampus argenteus]